MASVDDLINALALINDVANTYVYAVVDGQTFIVEPWFDRKIDNDGDPAILLHLEETEATVTDPLPETVTVDLPRDLLERIVYGGISPFSGSSLQDCASEGELIAALRAAGIRGVV